ncbi:MAG: hypothetical protein L0G25_06145 [Psychrobacter sp.]|nr:hypothetical protein [Psychrobacter sp.]
MPVNSAGILLDPVLTRSKTLYPDNYQRYQRACRDGSLQVGSCLLHRRAHERAGLSANFNNNQPIYIANLVVSDHPYHPTRKGWLVAALNDLGQQLMPLIRYKGIRKMSVLTRPLISSNPTATAATNTLPLEWQSTTLPLLIEHLQDLPKLRIELHVPKSIDILS